MDDFKAIYFGDGLFFVKIGSVILEVNGEIDNLFNAALGVRYSTDGGCSYKKL
jgi:hypothetical protein